MLQTTVRKLLHRNPLNNLFLTANAHRWVPDSEFMSQFDGPVMYPDEVTSKWKVQPYNAKKRPPERKVVNMTINFGPAHPAAHGCLRLITILDGEVSSSMWYIKLQGMLLHFIIWK